MTKTNESIEINKDIRMIEFDAGNEEEKSSKECMCVSVGVLKSSEIFTEIQTSTTEK